MRQCPWVLRASFQLNPTYVCSFIHIIFIGSSFFFLLCIMHGILSLMVNLNMCVMVRWNLNKIQILIHRGTWARSFEVSFDTNLHIVLNNPERRPTKIIIDSLVSPTLLSKLTNATPIIFSQHQWPIKSLFAFYRFLFSFSFKFWPLKIYLPF